MNAYVPQGALLVGSVPLASGEAVLRAVGPSLGRHLHCVPDGETGTRSNWIAWQLGVFSRVDGLEAEQVTVGYLKRAKFRLKPGVAAADVAFPALGYAGEAVASYAVFKRLKREGVLPGHLRFQVCLPTPFAPLHAYVFPEHQAAVAPAYESRMKAELAEILEAIPAGELAIQWDTAIEFAVLEGVMPTYLENPAAAIAEGLARWASWVPEPVELGFHLCYGDSGGRHFVEPRDAGRLVAVANALLGSVRRPLDWIHLPVPKERADDAYYAPLRDLQAGPSTRLYLGLLHADGANGARIEAAARHVDRFGIGTACGLGRRPPESVPGWLALHRECSRPVASA